MFYLWSRQAESRIGLSLCALHNNFRKFRLKDEKVLAVSETPG
jgi:hypothetical protein